MSVLSRAGPSGEAALAGGSRSGGRSARRSPAVCAAPPPGAGAAGFGAHPLSLRARHHGHEGAGGARVRGLQPPDEAGGALHPGQGPAAGGTAGPSGLAPRGARSRSREYCSACWVGSGSCGGWGGQLGLGVSRAGGSRCSCCRVVGFFRKKAQGSPEAGLWGEGMFVALKGCWWLW